MIDCQGRKDKPNPDSCSEAFCHVTQFLQETKHLKGLVFWLGQFSLTQTVYITRRDKQNDNNKKSY